MMDTIASLADNGFMKFCILNAHGGNSQGISVLLQRYAPDTTTHVTHGHMSLPFPPHHRS